jgi:cation transport ATPase
VKATINGTTWLVGNRRLLEEHGIAIGPEYRDAEKRWQEAAHTVIWFADGTGRARRHRHRGPHQAFRCREPSRA